jgi:hypothetical protein
MLRALGIAITLASFAWAGTAPKPKPGDYPIHARVGSIDLAAAYLVHTLPSETTNFLVPNYLVVEIAIYPPKSQPVAVAAAQFRLRVNKKTEVPSDTPQMVAMSLNYPDWAGHQGFDPQIGLGPVILGRPQSTQRVAQDQPPSQTAAEAAVALAFPDCPCERPVSGYVYFRYGKVKSIRSLELIWQDVDQQATIRLL